MAAAPPEQSCPRCAASTAAGARFCMTCGEHLGGPALAEAHVAQEAPAAGPAPERPPPEAGLPLVEHMRTARLSGERKPVTALFVDVVGSTAHLEHMDPEDWTAIITEAFELMSTAVQRYEGTVAQLQGDALLALFGAPSAHEDDPERAVLAALEMVDSVGEFARQLQADRGLEFAIRAGIDSGPVLVGTVGTDARHEYTALGDAVNVAARLQTAAEPGSVLVTASTHRLLGDQFDVEDRGEMGLRGRSEPVRVLRVIGRRETARPRRGLGAIGISSPMVGRDGALATLEGLVEIARAGRGRIAFLLGEPGIGKSRLIAELRRAAVDDSAPEPPARWVEGRCLSYGRGLPYHLLLEVVRSALQLPAGPQEPVAMRAAFDARLADELGDDAADVAPYLAHLMELPLREAEADRARLEPELMLGRYTASLVRLLRGVGRERPVILVCEDIHWADPASVEVLRGCLPLLGQLPVLLLAAMRRETESHGWTLLADARAQAGAGLTELELQPLSDADSRVLVANLLVIESLPPQVRELILTRADGNPFFVEEVVRMLIERGLIERRDGRWHAASGIDAVDIPETLHSLLLARIDQLPEAARRSLRVAAVIGRQFPLRVLEQVLGTEAV